MRRLLWLLAAGSLASITSAQVVYDNGLPDLANAFHSDFDTSNPSDTVQVGDDFVLGAAASFNHIKFFGVYAFDNIPTPVDSFTVRVFDLTGGPPPNLPLVEVPAGPPDSRVLNGQIIFGFQVYEYHMTVPSIVLPAGTYLLSIVNNTAGTVSDWFWCTTANTLNSWERDTDAAPWIVDNNAYAFTLSNDSPPCGTVYCTSNPDNSATIAANTCSCSAGSVNISMSGATAGTFAYLLVSASMGTVTDPPGAAGDLCLTGSPIGRYVLDLGLTDGAGNFSTDVLNALTGGGGGNLPNPPGGNICAPPGQTWNFQFWYRDAPNPAKFSQAVSVTFLP